MNLTGRLSKLEQRTQTTDAARVALMKPSEIQARADALRAGIITKWNALLMGETITPQPMTEAAAEILRRLEKIAEAQNEKH